MKGSSRAQANKVMVHTRRNARYRPEIVLNIVFQGIEDCFVGLAVGTMSYVCLAIEALLSRTGGK